MCNRNRQFTSIFWGGGRGRGINLDIIECSKKQENPRKNKANSKKKQMLLVPARFIFGVRVFFYYLLLVTFVRTGITFTLYPVLINWVLSWIFNKVKLLLCSFVFPVEVACIPLSLYHSWIWLGGVESLTVHFVLFAWALFVFTLRSEVEGKIQLILFTGITLYSLILRRYQYDNFHLHITIIVQITNQIKSNVGFGGEGKTGIPGEKPLGAERRINKLSPLRCWVRESNPGHNGGRWVLSPLRQSCSPLSLQLE